VRDWTTTACRQFTSNRDNLDNLLHPKMAGPPSFVTQHADYLPEQRLIAEPACSTQLRRTLASGVANAALDADAG